MPLRGSVRAVSVLLLFLAASIFLQIYGYLPMCLPIHKYGGESVPDDKCLDRHIHALHPPKVTGGSMKQCRHTTCAIDLCYIHDTLVSNK